MLLGELIQRRKILKSEVKELENYLLNKDVHGNVNDIINKIFILQDKIQKYSIAINRANNDVEVEIGTTKVSISTAVELRTTVLEKIETMASLISNPRNTLDIFNLMEQRTKLIEEYMLLNRVININDWSINVD